MIPKKAGTDVDLNAQIDKDLQQAQEAQKDKITKNKPTLAQAIGSKYLKLVVAGVIGVGIAYKMFFAPEPENVKGKKKSKKQIETSKSTIDNVAEKKNADAIMHMIPLVCLLSFTMNKSNQFAGAFL